MQHSLLGAVLGASLAAMVFFGATRLAANDAPAEYQAPSVPMALPAPNADGVIALVDSAGVSHATTIDSELQTRLESYLVDSRSPIAAAVVADARTGEILAMAQGRAPGEWGGKTHTALHAGFPAASLFKTVVTTAAFEVAGLSESANIGLSGGCSHVRETGEWLKERTDSNLNQMTLRRAYGFSCNGFFAKIAVNHLGLGPIVEFAHRYGWETGFPTDFAVERSPFMPPSPATSSTYTVGAFAAGFGYVGLSPVHAASMMLTIANRGQPVPLKLFKDSPKAPPADPAKRVFGEKTAAHISEILDATVRGGTASFAFRRGKYRKFHDLVGGKTGTLTGSSPKGITTWFAGMAPVKDPEIVVASVVMLDDRWHIKAPNLAAEAIWSYFEGRKQASKASPVSKMIKADAKDSNRFVK